MKKDNIYSIRKTKIGTFSAKITVVTFLAIAGGEAIYQHNNITYAADVISEERTIESPIKYTADETKDVGYRELKTKGENGSLKLIEKDGNKIAERKEPTESEVVLGTKPQIERKIEKSKVEYVVDDTKNFGTREVVKEAKNGETTKITTYKIVTSPKVKLSEKIEKMLNSDKYRFTDEKFYSIGDSKELPSDKIVIDKLFVSVPEKQNVGEKSGVRDLIQTGELKIEEGKLKDKYITPEMMDPNNPNIRAIKRAYYTFNEKEDSYREFDYSNDKDFYSILLKESYDGMMMLSGGHYLTNEVLREVGEDKSVERYFAKHIITDSMYADAKANYKRLQLAKEKLGNLTKSQKQIVKYGEILFSSITQHYNYVNGHTDSLNIKYEGNIPDNVKKEFEKQILKLPFEIRKNIVQLNVITGEIPQTDHAHNNNRSLIGLASFYRKDILQKYEENREVDVPTTNGKKTEVRNLRQPEALLDNLMHEISHIIDSNGGLGSGFFGYDGIKGYGIVVSEDNPYRFSNSKEFDEVYNKYFKNEINYKNYYRTSKEEAFADSLGEYINKRIFGVPYTRYKNIAGVEYEFKDVNDPNYATATTPVDKAEYYFANLYNKLFEQPTEGKVEINTIKETHVDVQDGKVVLGTKPKEEIIRVAYDTEERIDSTLPKGMRKVLQSGVNGEILKISSYLLVNKETGELTTQVSERIIKNSIKEIILVGSKVENNEPKPKPIPGPGDKPKPDPKPGLGDKPKPNPEPAPGDGPIADPKPAPGDGPKPDPKPAPGDKPKPDPKPGLGDTPNPGDKAPGSSNNQSNLQSPRVNSNGLKTLPNTGESQTGVATVAGLVALAVAARLKRKDKQN